MRYIPIIFLVAAGFSGLAGCATFPPPKEKIPTSRVYGKDYNEVWDAVLASLSELNIPVKSMDKESGTIVAEENNIELVPFETGRYDSKYCFCGSPEKYHVLRGMVGEYKISITGGKEVPPTLNIDVSFLASSHFGEVSTGWQPCISKGVFERIFLEQVDSRLQDRKSPASPPRKLDWWRRAGDIDPYHSLIATLREARISFSSDP